MNRVFKISIYIAILLIISAGASATEFLSVGGEGYLSDTVYNDDVYITGSKIKMESRVEGDLFAFCQEIVHSDTVAGSLNAFCMNIQVLGPVEQTIRGFGYSINCNAPVGRNALLFGKDITVGPQAEISKDADIFCSRLVFQGNLDGDLRIKANEAEISGHIKGDVEFEDGYLKIGPDAVIDGDLYYKSYRKAEVSESAVIFGETNWEEVEREDHGEGAGVTFWKIFAWFFSARGYLLAMSAVSLVAMIFSAIPFPAGLMIILYSVIFLISGNVVILLSKERMKRIVDAINIKFLPSLGLGFIIFFVGPVVSLVILLTVVGAPLGIALLFLFGAALFVAIVYSSTFVGWKIWEFLGRKSENKSGHLCYSTGIIVLIILSLIPVLGYLLITIAIMTGLGGLAHSFKPKNI